MKKLLIMFLFAPCFVQGQTGAFFGITNGFNKVSLQNKDDRKAGNELDMKSTIKYSGGIVGGYHFERQSGLTAISLGIQYTQMGQKYAGDRGTGSSFPKFDAYTNLDYLKVPLDFKFSINSLSNIRPYATVGLYFAYLTHYKDYYFANGSTNNETETIEDNSYTSNYITTVMYHGTLGEGIYRKIDFGGRLGVGAEYFISERWSLDASVRLDYGFTNPENRKDEIDLTFDPDVIIFNPNAKLTYWSEMKSKYNYDASYTSKRSPTHNMSMGFFLTINHYLKS